MNRNEYMREYYHKPENKRRIKARVKRYQEENPDAVLRTRLLTHEKNPSKPNARRVVEAAVKAGVLSKPGSCSKCGKTSCRIEAHHEDHARPLDVTWLCVSCHRKRDAEIRREKGEIAPKRKSRKLSDDMIREIRASDLSYSQLRKKYGVAIGTLQKIKHCQTYKDVK